MPISDKRTNASFKTTEWTRQRLRSAADKPNAEATIPVTEAPRAQEREETHEFKKHWRGLALSAFAVVVALLVLFAGLDAQNLYDPAAQQAQVNQAVARALASVTPAPPVAVGVYNTVRPALVEVMAHERDDTGTPVLSYGTGVIIAQDGTVLTSLHIVKGSDKIDVAFSDGSESPAHISKYEDNQDIAFLEPDLPPQQIAPAVIGNPHALQIGDQAIVVGNPMRLAGSLSVGAISGLERMFQPPGGGAPMEHMIQVDAAINPGNSGGPLLNSRGEVVGIITGRANPSGEEAFIGIGFAVPIDQALSINGPLPY